MYTVGSAFFQGLKDIRNSATVLVLLTFFVYANGIGTIITMQSLLEPTWFLDNDLIAH